MPYTQDDLDVAELHLAEGEQRVSRQQALIGALTLDGCDTSAARDLLVILQRTQKDLVAHRNRIASEVTSTLSQARSRKPH